MRMRRIVAWLLGTAVTVALMISYRTSTPGGSPAPAVSPAPGRGVDGKLVPTRYGPLQVRVTVTGSKITEIVLVAAPAGSHRTDQINRSALPQLRARALAAQSADIDTVSGATYTSAGYRKSLQAALDKIS